MTPDERAFVEAWVEHKRAEREESQARQRTYELEKVSYRHLQKLNELRVRVIGHDRMVTTEADRKKLFDLIEEGDRRAGK